MAMSKAEKWVREYAKATSVRGKVEDRRPNIIVSCGDTQNSVEFYLDDDGELRIKRCNCEVWIPEELLQGVSEWMAEHFIPKGTRLRRS